MRKILDTDPITGIRHVFDYDNETDQATITAEQDVGTVVEANKAAFNDAPTRHGEWTKVASLPLVVYMDLKQRGILDDQKKLKEWLNSSENRHFRTRPGRV